MVAEGVAHINSEFWMLDFFVFFLRFFEVVYFLHQRYFFSLSTDSTLETQRNDMKNAYRKPSDYMPFLAILRGSGGPLLPQGSRPTTDPMNRPQRAPS